MKEVHIYIESSISWPKKGDCIVGIIFADNDDEHTKTIFGQVKNASANLATLIAVKKSLYYCDFFHTINFHLSNSYVASSFDRLAAWELKDYKTSRGEDIKYLEEWKSISEMIKGKEINIYLDQFNGYYRWLKNECITRAEKHGFIL